MSKERKLTSYRRVLLRLHNEQGGGWDKDHSGCNIDCAWHASRLLLEADGLWPASEHDPRPAHRHRR